MAEGKKSSSAGGRDSTSAARGRAKPFTEEERAAMREAARERRINQSDPAAGEREVLAKIAELPEADRAIAERLHALVKATAPHLTARTWYGMPAYAEEGAILLFFQSAQKFKTRYATLGFSDKAKLDDGGMWPTTYALKRLGPEEEARVEELLRRAVG
ncbi:MAG: iron chaperone [Candidatus Dormibacteria bacterium]